MKSLARFLPSIGFSILFNLGILAVFLLIAIDLPSRATELMLESFFSEDLLQEEVTRELDLQTDPAETLNVIAGGTPSTSVGAAAQPAAAPVNVQKASVMKEVNIRPVMTDLALPADALIGQELGEGEIIGEVGSMVEGYGAAMGIITQEIVRMMRKEKVTLIWLFDESGSLEDDRKEIRENYLRVYDELGIVSKQDNDLKRGGNDLLLTVVASYGRDIHEHTPRPTDNIELIKAAIDRIQTDTTGEENMCHSIAWILEKYKKTAKTRKLAVIVVSDESGNDGDYVESAVAEAKAAGAPVYFLGRESMFGYPHAHTLWVDEPTGESFWLPIRRGPETPFPECLQWNGLHARSDGQSSGFGPYEQVRLARETGGIFFVLPGDEANLIGQSANDKRKYDFLSMRQYQPNLISRPEYIRDRATSEFRETLWRVVSSLNPNSDPLLFQESDPELNIGSEHFPLLLEDFKRVAAAQVIRAVRAMVLTDRAIELMEQVKPLRATEATERWRAGYDLALAQLYMFRMRLFQFLLAMDKHANAMPQPTDPKSNEWNFWWDASSAIVPDEAQFARLKTAFNMRMNRDEYLEMVKAEESRTVDLLKAVMTDHPGTPWARRAELELGQGFGFRVVERYWNYEAQAAVVAAKRIPNL